MHGLGKNLRHWLSNLDTNRFTAHDGVESIVVVSGVVDDTVVTIGIQQTVLSLYLIFVAGFMLALDVSGVLIMDRVGEFVVWRSILFDLFDVGWLSDGLHVGWLSNGFNIGWLSNNSLQVSRLGNGFDNCRLNESLQKGLLVVDWGLSMESLRVMLSIC